MNGDLTSQNSVKLDSYPNTRKSNLQIQSTQFLGEFPAFWAWWKCSLSPKEYQITNFTSKWRLTWLFQTRETHVFSAHHHLIRFALNKELCRPHTVQWNLLGSGKLYVASLDVSNAMNCVCLRVSLCIASTDQLTSSRYLHVIKLINW